MFIDQRVTMRKAEVVGFLERICEALEPLDSQRELAKNRYEAVGKWLAEADDPVLRTLAIYLQGSSQDCAHQGYAACRLSADSDLRRVWFDS